MELKEIFGARLKNARIINGMSMDDIFTLLSLKRTSYEKKIFLK